MILDAKERGTIQDIFRRADAVAASEMIQGALEPAAVLALFGILRDAVRPLDPRFADELVAHAAEDAASQLAARAITAQITSETQWAVAPKGAA